MKYCPRCGSTVGEKDKFCSNCGLSQEQKPGYQFPWRVLAIVILSIFIVLGVLYLAYEHFIIRPEGQIYEDEEKELAEELEEKDDFLIGEIYGEELVESWDYPGGVIEEYKAFDADGNPLTIYRDLATGEIRSFTAVLPPAEKVTLSIDEAQRYAEEIASKVYFYDDSNIILTERELIDYGPDTEKYYFFNWQAQDPKTGAKLLRQIQVCVHPQSGGIIYFLVDDGGEVEISTEPYIARADAVELALKEVADYFSESQVINEELYVTTAYNNQKLVWGVVIREGDPYELDFTIYVVVDALDGNIIEVTY